MIRASIRRPVAVTMLYVSIALLGVTAWRNISVERLPNVSFPQLSLSFGWPGASPETVEAFATSPIESTIQQLKGIERITSVTNEGSASITVIFARETDMDFARLDLSERLASLEEELPEGMGPIAVSSYVPREFEEQAAQPFLAYTFTGPFLLEALRLHLDEVVVPELTKIQGVSEVQVDGGRARLLEIELDPERIAALGLSPAQVSAAVSSLEIVREAGAVRSGELEWAVTIRSRPVAAADLRRAILPVPNAGAGAGPVSGAGAGVGATAPIVRLEDVGEVRDTFAEPTSHYRIDGSPAVSFRVIKEYGTNTIELSEIVRARVDELARVNPPGTQTILTYNQSDDIQRELSDLRTRAIIASVVVFVVLLAFLWSFRTAGIVFATIAFSILIALNLIYFSGMTLNLLTLMGLALGFGLIVDNAIVVLENIYRKWEEGSDPVTASEKGARDVILPIVASSATNLIVFVPFLYLQGESRIYYLPLAIVVSLVLIASMFVSFSFIPALTARVLATGAKSEARARIRTGPPFYVHFYGNLLGYTLRFPWVTAIVAAVCLGGSYYVFDTYVSRGALWGGGSGLQRSTININITMPRGSDLERMDELTRYFEDHLAQMPEVERFTTNVSSGIRSTTVVSFPLELEYTAVPLAIQERLFAYSLGFTGAEVRIVGIGPSFYGGSGGAAPNYTITVLGYNYDRLAEIAEEIGGRLQSNSRVYEMNTNASAQTRDRVAEFVAEIDREAAARHGVTVQEVVALLSGFLRGGTSQGRMTLAGDPVNFAVRLEGFRRVDVRELTETVVATSQGSRIPIGQLIRVQEREVLTSIRRENQQYERRVAYEFRGPRLLGDLVRDAALDATDLPPGYSLRASTFGLITREDLRQLALVLLISIGLIFMVTAALYESVRQPLVILLAVPMALIGVFLTFFYMNATFTREAYVGVIMMGGVVVNNAILLVDHVNRVRAERRDLPLSEAIVQGTLERVRPILMTTATTVLGLLPLVLFMPAADARIWNALTYSMIGGLLSSTLFVLTTTPALYLLFERGKAARAGPAVSEDPSRRVAALTIGLVALLSGCESGDPAADGSLPTLAVTQDWVIDGYEADLVPIDKLVVSSRDEVYVSQRQDAEILKFGSDGVRIGRFGGSGDGPGEFADVTTIGLLGDTLWVHDYRQRRITLVSPDLQVLRTAEAPPSFIPGPTPTEFIGILFEGLTADGAFHAQLHKLSPDGVPTEQLITRRGILELDGSVRRTFMEYARGPSERLVEHNGNMTFMIYPFTIAPLVATAGDGSAWALVTVSVEGPDAGTFQFARFDAAGDTVTAGRYSYEPVPLPRALADAVIDSIARTWTRPAGMEAKYRAAAWVPPVFPPVEDLVVGRDGSTWIRMRSRVEGESLYLVLDSLGAPHGQASVPGAVRIAAADLSDAWGISTDSLGVQGVVKYSVSPRVQ